MARKEAVLLIDDHADTRRAIALMLEKLGFP